MDNVENEVVRCRKSGLTQKISEIPQPGLRYSHKHLLSTLWRRSDSSRVLVCSLRNSRFKDESEVFSNRADFRPCTEGFSCSFSAPAKSTRVRAPMLLLLMPPSPPPPPTSAGFCTKMWTMAWDLEELELQEEVPDVRFTRASWSKLVQVALLSTCTILYQNFCVFRKSSSETTSSCLKAPLFTSGSGLIKSISVSPKTS